MHTVPMTAATTLPALPAGRSHPLGAHWDGSGVSFAVVSRHAEAVVLCLFDEAGHETIRYALVARDGDVWHGRLEGAGPGVIYGFRVHGPYLPSQGHRFNSNKLLLDPYARAVVGRYEGQPQFAGARPGHPDEPDPHDNAAIALKARVVHEPFDWQGDAAPTVRQADRVLCEAHVKSLTARHPGVPAPLRGSYAGVGHEAVLGHLRSLGVTSLSLMPVHARADEARLLRLGLSNHWGYNSIGFFAPEPRYWSGRSGTTPISEFRDMVRAVHAHGLELLLDVVYNHTAESDETGPTLSLRGLDNALYYRLMPGDPARYENHAGCGNTLDLGEPRVLQLVMDSLRYWVQEMHVDGFRFDLAPVLARGPAGFDPRAAFLAALRQDPVLARCTLIAEPWDIGPGGYALGRFPPGWLEWNDRYRDAMRRAWLHAGTPGAVDRAEFARRFAASSDVFEPSRRGPQESVHFVCAHDGFTLHDLVSYNHKHNQANGEHNRDGHSHNHSWNCGHEGPQAPADVQALRLRLKRALLATLMLSQGTPMLLAGDELGHSQQGNNNAYCQDNALSWMDWSAAGGADDLAPYIGRLAAVRRALGEAHRSRWYQGEGACGDAADIHWLTPEDRPMQGADWHAADPALAVHLTGCTGADDAKPAARAWLLLFNPAPTDRSFALPPGPWAMVLDSAADGFPERLSPRLQSTITATARSVAVLEQV